MGGVAVDRIASHLARGQKSSVSGGIRTLAASVRWVDGIPSLAQPHASCFSCIPSHIPSFIYPVTYTLSHIPSLAYPLSCPLSYTPSHIPSLIYPLLYTLSYLESGEFGISVQLLSETQSRLADMKRRMKTLRTRCDGLNLAFAPQVPSTQFDPFPHTL